MASHSLLFWLSKIVSETNELKTTLIAIKSILAL